MYLEETEDSWKKQKEAVNKAIKANGGKSKVLGSMKKELVKKEDPEVKKRCRLTRMILDESLEMYEEEEMSFDEMIKDLNKSLKAI